MIRRRRARGRPPREPALQLGSLETNTALSYRCKVRLKPGSRYSYGVLVTDAAGNVAAKIGSAKLTVR